MRTTRLLMCVTAAVFCLALSGTQANAGEMQRQYQLLPGARGALVLRAVQAPVRQPDADEVLVRVRATSLNRRDLGLAARRSGSGTPENLVPLSDGAGEVVAVGKGVSRFQVGDRVAAIFFQQWIDGRPTPEAMASDLGGSINGMLSEFVTLHEDGLVRIPDYMSFEEAATLPCAAVTAWNALVTRGAAQPGERVLLLGTGGVSVFGLQLALAMGLETIITSSSDNKLERARQLGAHHTINYRRTPEWQDVVLDITGGTGVQHVLEVGGRGTLERSLASLGHGGHVAVIGTLAGSGASVSALSLLFRNITASGIYVGSREDFEAMNAFLALHELRPAIDRIFEFEEAQEAYDYMASSKHFAKIVIRL